MRYKFLSGDINWQVYGGKFISPRLNNGDWDYWLIISVTNQHEFDESLPKYRVDISAVSPQAAGEDNIKRAVECEGFEDLSDFPPSRLELLNIEALSDYGIAAYLWHEEGNDIAKLLKEARSQSDVIEGLFGFYMDAPQNRIGQSGWDLIAGQDISEF